MSKGWRYTVNKLRNAFRMKIAIKYIKGGNTTAKFKGNRQ